MQIRIGYKNKHAFLSFPYNQEVINIIKMDGDCMFDRQEKYWRINISTIENIVKKLQEAGFTVVKNKNYKDVFGE